MNLYAAFYIGLLVCMPQQLFAIPGAIKRIVRTFEGNTKQKTAQIADNDIPSPVVPKASEDEPSHEATLAPQSEGLADSGSDLPLPSLPSNVMQAKLAIDIAVKDETLCKHPATWYYRGVIYERLLRDDIASESASGLLDEALLSYTRVKQLSKPHTQFYSFAAANLASLWHTYLDRGIRYCKQQQAFDRAVDALTICRRICTEETALLLYMAIVYHMSDQLTEAMHYYEAYLRLEGTDLLALRAMSHIAYHQLHDFDRAIEWIDQGLAKAPLNNELLVDKRAIYEAAGKLDIYLAALLKDMQVPDRCITAWYIYAHDLAMKGALEAAMIYCKKILDRLPDHYHGLRTMGLLFYNMAIQTHIDFQNYIKENNITSTIDNRGSVYVRIEYLLTTESALLSLFPSLVTLSMLCTKPSIEHVPFFVRKRFKLYAYPSLSHSTISDSVLYCHLLATAYDPVNLLHQHANKIIVNELLRYKHMENMVRLERMLTNAVKHLKNAYKQDKQDNVVAQSLYHGYYHLKQYRAAHKLLSTMQRNNPGMEAMIDPFYSDKKDNIVP